MADTPLTTAPDWRGYAAEIRATLMAGEPKGYDFDADGPAFGPIDDDAETAKAATVLTHRQSLMIRILAATLGSREALGTALGRNGIAAISDIPGDILGRHRDTDAGRAARRVLHRRKRPQEAQARRGHPVRRLTILRAQAADDPPPPSQARRGAHLSRAGDPAPAARIVMRGFDRRHRGDGFPIRPLDAEIATDLLAEGFPGADADTLRSQLPADDHLARTPMLWLFLAMRSSSAEAAASMLRQDGWPTPMASEFDETDGATEAPKVDPHGIRLADLAGLGAAKDIALGIVEDLRAWAAGDLNWRDVHRGLLIAGPPGSGKTELARAMARETGIHLATGSYGEWQARDISARC